MPLTKRARRWLLMLSVLALLLVVGAWWVDRQLEPERLTATVLDSAGKSLNLELHFEGPAEYALRPEPRLLIPNFSARTPDGKIFLSARLAEISLPWSTITGDEPVITRIELEGMALDVPGLRSWLASRPKQPFKLPTLTKGLRIVNGAVSDSGYSIRHLDLELPRLKTGEPAKLNGKGVFSQGETSLAFQLSLDAMTPGPESNFSLQATGELEPAATGAKPPVPAVADTSPPAPATGKFDLNASGHYAATDAGFTLHVPTLKFDAASPLPSVSGQAKFVFADRTQLDFDGVLVRWPKSWPALPQPLDQNTDQLPVRISYLGRPDLGDPISLTVSREPTVLTAALRIDEVRQWLDASAGSPLPPLNGSLRTPTMVFDGIELQGVEIEVSEH